MKCIHKIQELSSAIAEMGDRLATIDMRQKLWGAAVPLLGKGKGRLFI